jgi:uncharacterized OsmC-like protein/TusA-related sulfurtransferase
MSEPIQPDAVCDGGDLDCGSGLLLIIREAMSPLPAGGVLEVRSRESSVAVDLPAWCRLVGHDLVAATPHEIAAGAARGASYFVRKRLAQDDALQADLARARAHVWTVRARAQAGMSARVFARNHAFDVGQPASFDTSDAAPSAVEHLLGALAGCLAVGMRWRAVRRGIEVFELEVSLRARLADPLVFLGLAPVGEEGGAGLARVEGRLFIDADADDLVLDELWRETLQRSPVANTLTGHVPVTIERRSH